MYHVLLINPFASAGYLYERLNWYGIKTTALYTISFDNLSTYLRPKADMFSHQIHVITNDINEIIQELGNQKFDYVINGFESSVLLSDLLAQHYTPQYANDPNTYKSRSNKYEMHQTLAQNHIPHIKQYLYEVTAGNDLPPIDKLGFNYPCFIKPLSGAASIGAKKIINEEEYKDYFSELKKYSNIYQTDETKDKFLIAEHINGIEMFVDTFSVKGKHYIASIQRYRKELFNNKPVYLYLELEQDQKIIAKTTSYINDVLNATNFLNGFAHTELFLLPNYEIKLIEINPRISGTSGMINKIALLNKGADAITLLMHHIFKINCNTSGDKKHYRCLVLSNLSGNPLYNLQHHLSQYKTVFEVLQLVPEGHITPVQKKEITLADANAFVILRADNMEDINSDSQAILTQDQLGWNMRLDMPI